MQDKINSFNAAFVDLAAGYVNRVAIRAAQKEPEPKGAAQQFRYELANEIQLANLLVATIGKMQAASGGELPADVEPHTAADNLDFLRGVLEGRVPVPEGTVFNVNISTGDSAAVQLKPEADGEPEPPTGPHLRFQDGRVRVAGGTEAEEPTGPEPVTPGAGRVLPAGKTQVSGPCSMEDSAGAEAMSTLKDLCGYCRMLAKNKWAIQTEREWDADVAALEFAISILSELKEIKEVRISAEPNTPGAWELMRGVLAGKWQMPEGCAFNITVDAAGNALDVDPEPKPGTERALTISMPGGTETVKLTSIAEAYGMADCIKKMAACVWPEAANEPAPGGA